MEPCEGVFGSHLSDMCYPARSVISMLHYMGDRETMGIVKMSDSGTSHASPSEKALFASKERHVGRGSEYASVSIFEHAM